MKKAIHFTLVMSLICLIMAFASCKKPEDEEKGLVEITYVANGGNIEVTTHNIEVGMISGLYVPTRDNYKFLGWYKEADFSGETYFNYEATKAEKITLYAKWEIIIDYDKVTNTKAAINALVKIISLEDEDQLITNINTRIDSGYTNIKDPNSYTFVYVHVWSNTMDNVNYVVNKLNKNSKVRIVSPDTFIKLIISNVPHVDI